MAPAARDGDLLDRIRRLTRPDSLPARRAVAMPALAAMLAVAIAGAGVQAGPADDAAPTRPAGRWRNCRASTP